MALFDYFFFLVDCFGLPVTPQALVPPSSHRADMFRDFLASYAFSANYIIGVGVFSLPTAMYYGGTVVSSIFFLILGWISGIFMIALTEVTGRGVELMKWKKFQRKIGRLDQALLGGGISVNINEVNDLLSIQSNVENAEDAETKELSEYDELNSPTFLYSDHAVIEITTLARLFCGKVGEISYFISLFILIFCGI